MVLQKKSILVLLDLKTPDKSRKYLESFQANMVKGPMNQASAEDISQKLQWVTSQQQKLKKSNSWEDLIGTLGADILFKKY